MMYGGGGGCFRLDNIFETLWMFKRGKGIPHDNVVLLESKSQNKCELNGPIKSSNAYVIYTHV